MGFGATGAGGAMGGMNALAAIRALLEKRAVMEQQAKQQEFENSLALRGQDRSDRQLEAVTDGNALNRQSMMAQREAADADRDAQRNINVRESLPPETFLPEGDPMLAGFEKAGLSGTLRMATKGAMGQDFQGPMPTGETPEQARAGIRGRLTMPTARQAEQANDNARAEENAAALKDFRNDTIADRERDNARQDARDARETSDRNQARQDAQQRYADSQRVAEAQAAFQREASEANQQRLAAVLEETGRHNRQMEARGAGGVGARAPIAVLGPDGKPVYVSPEQAYGKTPASSRDQGRQVTSGDARKLTEYDASLTDAGRLRTALTGTKSTGAEAKLGAMAPNFVTEFTGFGTDAKKKQALIDRVKQVIGKSLEEGVLRKEDELKYEKILPTIGDPPAVVTSKIQGLEVAIASKRQQYLDNLESAGFDVSNFNNRKPATTPAAPAGGTRKVGRFEIVESK